MELFFHTDPNTSLFNWQYGNYLPLWRKAHCCTNQAAVSTQHKQGTIQTMLCTYLRMTSTYYNGPVQTDYANVDTHAHTNEREPDEAGTRSSARRASQIYCMSVKWARTVTCFTTNRIRITQTRSATQYTQQRTWSKSEGEIYLSHARSWLRAQHELTERLPDSTRQLGEKRLLSNRWTASTRHWSLIVHVCNLLAWLDALDGRVSQRGLAVEKGLN